MSTLLQRALLPILAAVALAVSLIVPPQHASAIIEQGQQGCPNGQVVGVANLVQDGNFSEAFDGTVRFTTDLPRRDSGTYPSDQDLGGYAIQRGGVSYLEGLIVGRPFPGDPSREVPASATYFYSNPYFNANGSAFYSDGEGLLWSQTVNVTADRLYNFYAYFDNLLTATSEGNDPVIELRVDDPDDAAGSIKIGTAITVTKEPDTWIPIQFAFQTITGQSRITLEVWDVTGKFVSEPTHGSDFAMVAVNVRQCAWPVGISKQASAPVANADGSYTITYTLNLKNYSPDQAVTNLQVIDNLAATFKDAKDGAFTLVAVTTSPNLSKNPDYTGISPNTNLLAPDNTLGFGDQGTASITITVSIRPGDGIKGRGPFANTAIVSASSDGTVVEDDSNPGIAPDLNSNGSPKDPSEDKPTEVNIGAKLALPIIIK